MISASPRRLSVFKSVVDAGGFNVAALQLGIAQPSVGAHIKALEIQVGQPLFHRSRGRRPTLTKAGETLYAYAADVLQRSQAATGALTDLRAQGDGEVSLAIHRDVAPHLLAAHLAAFSRERPNMRILTRTGTIEDIVALAREEVVSLAVVLSAGPVPGLDSDLLLPVPLRLVVAPSHPLAGRRAVEAAEVMRHPFVTGLKHSRYMQMVRTALKACGIEIAKVAMELQDSASVKEMVRLGTGIAALPACTVEQEIARRALVPLDLRVRPPDFELRCAYRAPLMKASADFRDHLCARFARSRAPEP